MTTFFDVLKKMGCNTSEADPDVWMRPAEDKSCYEYIAVYVDDLAISMRTQRKSLMISISSLRELDHLPITWDVLIQETLMAHF